MKKLLLLSGPFHVGKTTVANELCNRLGFTKVSSGDYLRGIAKMRGMTNERIQLQKIGDQLDIETDYKWIVSEVSAKEIERQTKVEFWLFDSVRKHRQVEHFRAAYNDFVCHVHLTCPEATLRKRYSEGEIGGNSYDDAILHPNEVEARSLQTIADLVIDTSDRAGSDIANLILQNWRA
tara:strand:- start:316 stop:852 length:537 start_codon:yes stop_codon:yes gene_type:complete